MMARELREKIRAGELVLGTQIVSTSPRWPQVMAECGLDFVFIDTEHIPIDRYALSWMCQTYAGLGLPPIVRIPSPDPYAATMALDGGAAGILAPYIETVEQVKALRGAIKLRPIKGQRLQQMLDDSAPTEPELAAYQSAGAANRVMIVNIESVPAIAALDDLLKVPDVDAVLIGPHDLSCSLGIPELYHRPEFLKACETIFRKARAAGVGAGIHFSEGPDQHHRFIGMGANLIIHSADITLFQKHLRIELGAIRQAPSRQS
jgi:4-hydroxy-2-oxoheptanedioate aldolase